MGGVDDISFCMYAPLWRIGVHDISALRFWIANHRLNGLSVLVSSARRHFQQNWRDRL